MSFTDMTSKDLLTIRPLKDNTLGEDIYYEFIKFVGKFKLPFYAYQQMVLPPWWDLLLFVEKIMIFQISYLFIVLCAKMLN